MAEAAFNKDDLYYTDMNVGEILHRTRVHYGQTLQDIERALRIRSIQIEAIEKGDFENLPGRVYAIGFVRSYAEYLGLDGDRMVHLFKTQSGGRSSRPVLHFPVPASESKIPQVWVIVLSLCLTAAIVSGWWAMQSRDRTIVTEIPPVPDTMKTATQVTERSSPVARTADKPRMEGIILNIVQNSWVEIKDADGNDVVSRVLRVGDKYFVPDRPDLTMSLGNAGGVQIEIDGEELNPLGKVGEVRRNIPLDAKFLQKSFSKDAVVAVPAHSENPLEMRGQNGAQQGP